MLPFLVFNCGSHYCHPQRHSSPSLEPNYPLWPHNLSLQQALKPEKAALTSDLQPLTSHGKGSPLSFPLRTGCDPWEELCRRDLTPDTVQTKRLDQPDLGPAGPDNKTQEVEISVWRRAAVYIMLCSNFQSFLHVTAVWTTYSITFSFLLSYRTVIWYLTVHRHNARHDGMLIFKRFQVTFNDVHMISATYWNDWKQMASSHATDINFKHCDLRKTGFN